MASNRERPEDMTFQIRAIPVSLTERLEDWGDNRQLAQMINNIDAEDHIADLRGRVKNLTLTAVHHKDLRQSTTTAILAGVLPITILALLGAGAATLWKICGSSMSTKARQWIEKKPKNQGPYNLYIKRKQWRDPLQLQKSWKKLAAMNPSIYHLLRRLWGGKKKKSAGPPFRNRPGRTQHHPRLGGPRAPSYSLAIQSWQWMRKNCRSIEMPSCNSRCWGVSYSAS